ncbi:hypothetical protein LTR85_001914 [Meristemomyces frigidus]|nr:hypothetical protein LTR85_001914 [Meristemomyces frigidus]
MSGAAKMVGRGGATAFNQSDTLESTESAPTCQGTGRNTVKNRRKKKNRKANKAAQNTSSSATGPGATGSSSLDEPDLSIRSTVEGTPKAESQAEAPLVPDPVDAVATSTQSGAQLLSCAASQANAVEASGSQGIKGGSGLGGSPSTGGGLDHDLVQQRHQHDYGVSVHPQIPSGEEIDHPGVSSSEGRLAAHLMSGNGPIGISAGVSDTTAPLHTQPIIALPQQLEMAKNEHPISSGGAHRDRAILREGEAGTLEAHERQRQDSAQAHAADDAGTAPHHPDRPSSLVGWLFSSAGLDRFPRFWIRQTLPSDLATVDSSPTNQITGLQTEGGNETALTIRAMAAKIDKLTEQVAALSAKITIQEANPDNVRSPGTADAATTYNQSSPEVITPMDSLAVQEADQAVDQLLYARRLEPSWWVTPELRTKLKDFTGAVYREYKHNRFDDDMKLIIVRAVHQASHLWSPAPPLPRRGKLVPPSTALGEALRRDTVAAQASKMSGFQMEEYPSLTTRSEEVQNELEDFLARSKNWRMQTSFAELAYHLWADEAVHRIVTPDNFRQRIYWAFSGTLHSGLKFKHFYPHENEEPMEPHQAAADLIWRSHFLDISSYVMPNHSGMFRGWGFRGQRDH